MSLNRQSEPVRSRARMRVQILKLSLAALFISLSIVLTRYASITPLPSVRIGFGSLPIQIAGIILGPIAGAVVGLIADPIGFTLNPQGAYHIGFTLSAVLNGLIPGLIALGIKRLAIKSDRSGRRLDTLWIAIATTIAITAICSILLNTLWLSQILGTSYTVLLATRMPAVLISAVVHLVLLALLLPALDRAGATRIQRLSRR